MEDYSNDPVLKKFPCPLFKAQESEQKRLAALTQKVEQEKLAKQLIKSSLSGQALNKKIVFDNPVPLVKEEPVSKKLFAEDEDNEEFGGDQSYEFKRFKNSNESKIIGLQSRFAHDPRFKIDERFIDDEDNYGDYSHEQDEAKKEEEKQLDILEEVLGKPLKRKYNQPEESKHNSIIIPRYDPTKAESQKFKIRKVHKLEPYQLPENTEEENSKPEVSKERFYEISETFKKDFNDDQFDGQSFSLTKLFGRPAVDSTVEAKFIPKEDHSGQKFKKEKHSKSAQVDSDDDEDEDEEDEDDEEEKEDNEDEDESDLEQSNVQKPMAKASREMTEKAEKKKSIKDDSSKSESAQDKSNKKMKFRENSKVSNPLLKYERFFFTEDDKRLQNNTFYNNERIKSHIQSWKEKKIVMTTALTKKRRHFKHVSKLKTTLEAGNPRDKDLKKKYRILKKTTKKH
ncbi:uncharacterized protein DDB_G0283697 [Tetranychus urticae]|uniref:Nucleolar protein 8 n=1 Tax=Tetranychus urticae TaxID=32264 RepID=T1JSQ5_TETUR|nr:uncharacterized protein DDB_G0283697 [Tetranychus urticae]